MPPEPDFQPGDKVKVEGHEGIAEVIKIEPMGKQYNVRLYFEDSGKEEVRYIEVKGLVSEGTIELTENEWFKVHKIGEDYWLYIVSNALDSENRVLNMIQDPASKFREEDLLKKIRFRVEIANWNDIAGKVRI
ncbi:protein NO VEIN domain-containing protein [Candidatus Pyrohabitans sp.]